MTKRTLYVLGLGIFGIGTTEFGVIGILPQIAAAFGVSIDKAGWLLSSFALIIACSAPFMMLLFSRMERKKAMALVLLVFTLGNLVAILANSFPMLLFARMLPAFLHPVFWSIALATAAGSVPPAESPKAVGIVFGGFTIASVLGVPLATYMADLWNWRASFALCAGVNLLSLVGLLLLLPALPARQEVAGAAPLQILQRPLLWRRLLLALLMIAGMYATYGYFAVYLGSVTKMNGAQISGMLLIYGIMGVAGNWVAGRRLSISIRQTTIIFIVSLLAIYMFVYYAGIYFIPMVILIFCWGFIQTSGFLISNVNVTTAAPEAPELANSIFTSCGNLAVTIGSTIGGLTIAHLGIHQVIWASVLLLVLSCGAWLGGYF